MSTAVIIIIIAVSAAASALVSAVRYGMIDFLHPRPRPKPGQKRVACVGDSVTHGLFVTGRRSTYPAVLGRLLGKDFCVGNFGYSDRTASEKGDKPYSAEKLYRRSLDFAPGTVLLMLGSNDTKAANWDRQACLEGLCSLIDSYRALPSRPEVILLTPPPMFPVRGRIMWGLRDGILENEVICALLAQNAVHAALSGRKFFVIDGVHPNAGGAETRASAVCGAVAEIEESKAQK